MKLEYDKQTDSLYIHLLEDTAADSQEVREGVVLDFGAEGQLVGIDIQHASKCQRRFKTDPLTSDAF